MIVTIELEVDRVDDDEPLTCGCDPDSFCGKMGCHPIGAKACIRSSRHGGLCRSHCRSCIALKIDAPCVGHELLLEVTGDVEPYVAARIYGPPDSWHPSEGGEVDITAITLDGKPWDGELTQEEQARAEEDLRLASEDDGDEDPAEPDDN